LTAKRLIIKQSPYAIVSKNANWLAGEDCEVHTPQEIIQGQYAVTSLFNIAPSHLPPDFSANPKYPKVATKGTTKQISKNRAKLLKMQIILTRIS